MYPVGITIVKRCIDTVCLNGRLNYNTMQLNQPQHLSPLWSLALMSLSNSIRLITTSLLPVRDAWWEAVNLSKEKNHHTSWK